MFICKGVSADVREVESEAIAVCVRADISAVLSATT